MAQHEHHVPQQPQRAPAPQREGELAAPLIDSPAAEAEAGAPGDVALRQTSLLHDPRMLQRSSTPRRAGVMRSMQRGYGNSHVARLLAQRSPATAAAQTAEHTPDASPPTAERPAAPPEATTPAAPALAADAQAPAVEQAAPAEQAAQPSQPLALLTAQRAAQDATAAPTSPGVVARQTAADAPIQRWGVGSFLLDKVAGVAKSIPGYTLLTLMLGSDPISGEEVERSPKHVFHAALGLVPGGERLFASLNESGAIDKAFDWLQAQWAQLGLSLAAIKQLFGTAWDALSTSDLLNPMGAWDKLKGIFMAPIARVTRFVSAIGDKVMEFVLEGVLGQLGGQQVLGMLKRAGGAFMQIVKDPIGFLSNLISGVGQGFLNFGANILQHLQKGLMTWLFGELAAGGIALPERLDLKGILSLALQVLGLTKEGILAQATKLLGPQVVSALQGTLKIFTVLSSEGLGGLWELIKEQLSNLEELVIGGIKEMLITQVVQSGIKFLMSMLGGPAGALIKAIEAIYNAVMWFMNNASRLSELIGSIGESVAAIAAGNIGGAAKFVENALSNSVPVFLDLVAKLLGLGSLSGKIKGVIEKIQSPINKAVGWLLNKAKGAAQNLFKGAGKLLGGKPKTEAQKQADLDKGLKLGVAAVNNLQGTAISEELITPVLAGIRLRYGLGVLEPVEQDGTWAVRGDVQRAVTRPTNKAKPKKAYGKAKRGKTQLGGRRRRPAKNAMEATRKRYATILEFAGLNAGVIKGMTTEEKIRHAAVDHIIETHRSREKITTLIDNMTNAGLHNKIKGVIFERWMRKHNKKIKDGKTIEITEGEYKGGVVKSDGTIDISPGGGKKTKIIVEMKSVLGRTPPSSRDREQMSKYAEIINSTKTEYKKVKYIFLHQEALENWIPTLDSIFGSKNKYDTGLK